MSPSQTSGKGYYSDDTNTWALDFVWFHFGKSKAIQKTCSEYSMWPWSTFKAIETPWDQYSDRATKASGHDFGLSDYGIQQMRIWVIWWNTNTKLVWDFAYLLSWPMILARSVVLMNSITRIFNSHSWALWARISLSEGTRIFWCFLGEATMNSPFWIFKAAVGVIQAARHAPQLLPVLAEQLEQRGAMRRIKNETLKWYCW